MQRSISFNYRPKLQILPNTKINELHEASLKILSTTGIKITSHYAKKLLNQAGCKIKNEKVYINEELINWAINKCPSEVTIYGRAPKRNIRLMNDNVYFGSGADCLHYLDPWSHEIRSVKKHDFISFTKLCENLSNIDFVMPMGVISDVPISSADIWQTYLMIKNTYKPIIFSTHSLKNCSKIIEMLKILADGFTNLQKKPLALTIINPISPLQFSNESVDKIIIFAKEKIPMILCAGPMLGGTGPITMAGSIAMGNSEVLTGIVLSQLIKEGTPIVYGLGIHPLDMRTMVLSYGAPELAITTAIAVCLSNFYKLPCFGYAGCSDSKVVDEEAAMEATMLIIMSLLSGANLVHDVGYLESGKTNSPEMLVLCDVIISMCRRIIEGFELSEDTLALNIINKVGPGGHFLEEAHTITHLKDNWESPLIKRIYYEAWKEAGSEKFSKKIKKKTIELLDQPQKSTISKSINKKILSILNNNSI
jgi:trimethylamine--corrinoid protein Co-methyltransferase